MAKWKLLPSALAASVALVLTAVLALSGGPGPASLAQRSSQFYARALARAGLKVTPSEQKIIDLSLSDMAATTQLAAVESSSRIRLAEEILGQKQAAKKPVAAHLGRANMATPAFKKAFAEAAGDDVHVVAGHVKAAAKAAVLSRKIRVAKKVKQSQVAKEVKAAPAVVASPSAAHPNGFKAAMKRQLDQKASLMLHRREHAAVHGSVTSADLQKTEWDHSSDVYTPATSSSDDDDTKMSRVQLEHHFEAQLNGKAASIQRTELGDTLKERASAADAVLGHSSKATHLPEWDAAVDKVGMVHKRAGVMYSVGDTTSGTGLKVATKVGKGSVQGIEAELQAELSGAEHQILSKDWAKQLSNLAHSTAKAAVKAVSAVAHPAGKATKAAAAGRAFTVGESSGATELEAADGKTKSRMGLEAELAAELAGKVKELESQSAAVVSHQAHVEAAAAQAKLTGAVGAAVQKQQGGAVQKQQGGAVQEQQGGAVFDLSVGAADDGTGMKVRDSGKETNLALEATLRAQLNGEAGKMGAQELVDTQQSFAHGRSKGDVQRGVARDVARGRGEVAVDEATGLGKRARAAKVAPGDARMALEASLKAQLDKRDQATGHKWYLADLVSAESQAKGITA